jgi:DNA polymerase III subunit delta'
MQSSFSQYTWLNKAFEQLCTSHQKGKLAHGIMLVAPKGSGKQLFAMKLSASLLCLKSKNKLQPACGECKNCRLIDSGSHPDLSILDYLTDSKGKQKKSIGIDQVRELSEKLVETPQLGGWRIALIVSVEKLTRGAFNALLKTLEEPGRNTLLIMLADNAHRVPATIKSRCQLTHFELTSEQLCDWLVNQSGQNLEQAEKALKACYYSPFKSLDYLESNIEAEITELTEDLDRVLQTKLSPSQLIAKHTANFPELWLQIANYFQKVQLSILNFNQQTYSKVPAKVPSDIYQQLIAFNRAQCAGSNLQNNLQLETILIPWFELGRKIVHYSNR